MKRMKLYFIIPGNIHSLTGGYLYDMKMIRGLEEQGYDVPIIGIDEPLTCLAAIEGYCRSQFIKLPPGTCVVIDSLVLGLLHKLVREFSDRLNIVGLIHLPVTYNILSYKMKLADYEINAMMDASSLIVTGRFMVQLLGDAGIPSEKITIVEPGTERYPRKRTYKKLPTELLCISNYSAIKAQHVLVQALEKIRHMDWSLNLYGNMQRDERYVASLRSYILRKNLEGRILLHDTIPHDQISAAFLQSDLFILPSLFESFGMVLAESLAHGIPVVTTVAGNIPYTVPPAMGVFTERGNADHLAYALNELMLDEEKYASLYRAASDYHKQARSWETAISDFESIIRYQVYTSL
jgi:glycosyltransferase involved in cell wall biosynthesis